MKSFEVLIGVRVADRKLKMEMIDCALLHVTITEKSVTQPF